ncbi:MAG: AmmeMemoRadiSam system protein B [Phycisphaerales bacterium]
MSDPGHAGEGGQTPPWPPFDPNAAHQRRPRIRAVRGFGMQQGEQMLLGLADARQISDKIVVTSPAAQTILPHLTGEHELAEIVRRVNESLSGPQYANVRVDKLTEPVLQQFVAQLDDAGLLEGPTFDRMLEKIRDDFDKSEHLPPSVTANFADTLVLAELGEEASDEQKTELGPTKMRGQFERWIGEALEKAKDPSFDALPKAIVAPHLDYGRGWPNYAHAYGRCRVVDRPDRVLILGTNHFGFGTGVVGSDKGFETPFGVSPLDTKFADALRAALGDENAEKLFEHRYDHEREHSIELNVAWVQHVFGPTPTDVEGEHIPVFAALVHDPVQKNGESYDGTGLSLDAFVNGVKSAMQKVGGRTLVVASADLSHVGPQFGDQTPLAGDEQSNPTGVAARNKAIEHDRRMLEFLTKNKPNDMLAAMTWQRNPTRWCSIGNLVATMRIVEPTEFRLLQYTAAMDQQGMSMVSSCAAAMF